MAQKFLTDIEVTQGLVDSSGDLGVAGQVLSSTGTGTNWITNEANSTVVYQDGFTGDNSTVDFTLSVSVTDENITQVYLDGVYQHKDTYSVSNTTLTFSTAPPLNADIEVITFSTATTADDLQAGVVIIPVKNTHTASIAKGEPVYITGNVGSSARLQIAPADASNSAKMPAAGLLLQTLAVNAEGYVVTGGYLRNITTDIIDSTSTSSNDTVYVKPGGGLTMTKPTGSNLIQNIAKVARSSSANSGSLLVSSILRTNDVPNEINRNINFSDNSKLTFGNITSPDLQIYHDGSNSYISDTGTGNLFITGASNIYLQNGSNETYLDTTTNGAVRLYHDNSLKFETTSTGVSVTGNISPSGVALFNDGYGINFGNSNAKIYGSSANGIQFNAGGSEAMRLNQSGNLGIGQTSPNAKLEIYGTANSSPQTTNDGILKINSTSTNAIIFGALNSSPFGTYIQSGGSNTYPLLLNPNGGNVGIGTTSPDSITSGGSILTLGRSGSLGTDDVVGALSFHTNDASFTAYHSDGISAQISAHSDNPNGASGRLSFYTAYGSDRAERMRIDSSGLTRFTVDNSTASAIDIGYVSSARTIRAVETGGGNARPLTLLAQNFTFKDDSATRMTIDTSGNVGIGITSGMTYPLTVQAGSGNNSYIHFVNSTTGTAFSDGFQVGVADGSSDAFLLLRESANMRFYTGSSERMRITSGGDVIIGGTVVENPNSVNRAFEVAAASPVGLILNDTRDANPITLENVGAVFHVSHGTNRRLTILDSSGNVGIGTSSPGEKLHVNSGTGNVPALFESTDNLSLITFKDNNTTTDVGIGADDNDEVFYAGGSERMRITSGGDIQINGGDIFLNSGTNYNDKGVVYLSNERTAIISDIVNLTANGDTSLDFQTRSAGTRASAMFIDEFRRVGIGTTSPERFLHIFSSNVQIGALIESSNTTSAQLNFKNGSTTNNGGFVKTTGDNIILTANNTSAAHLVVANGGNVGIGTTSPLTELHVKGSTGLIGFGNSMLMIEDSSSNYSGIVFKGTTNYNAAIRTEGGTALTFWQNGGTGTSWNERMRIESTGVMKFSNNATSTGDVGTISHYTNNYMYIRGGTGGLAIGDDGFDTNIYINNSSSIQFGTSGSTKMVIDSSGNVGIGTTSPTMGLHVADTKGALFGPATAASTYISPTDENTINGGYGFDTDTADLWLNYRGYQDGFTRFRDTRIGNGKGSAIVMVDGSAGNVGIGTTSPASKLHVYSGTAHGEIRLTTATSSGYDATMSLIAGQSGGVSILNLGYNGDDDYTRILRTSAGSLRFDTNNAERMRLNPTNQTMTLTANTATGTNYIQFVNNAGTNQGYVGFGSSGTNDMYISQESSNVSIRFLNGGSERMRITSAGNVGIGTTSPGYMLHVESNSSSTSAAFFRPNVIGSGDPAEPTTVYIDGQKAPALDINRFYSHGTVLNIRQNNSNVGSISVTGVATSYNTSSDYRLKENVVEMTGALDRVSQLKPSRFNFISDADTTVDGFLAHEVSNIVPEAITGEKDAIDEEGNPVYQGIDQSKLVPLLVGAIQELKVEVETLKNQINGIN